MISADEFNRKTAALKAESDQVKSLNTELSNRNNELCIRIEELTAQVKWFQKQLFGEKTERRILEVPKEQLFLGEQFEKQTAEEEAQTVAAHQRKKKKTKSTDGDDSNLFFDENEVPVEEIYIENPETAGLSEDEYEIIRQNVSHKLAQRPAVYVVLKYIRDVIKKKDKSAEPRISCPSLPPEVFEKSHADVSFLAGLLVDKFQYHLPLYRQHQRLESSGIKVSRAWLTQLVHRSGNLLEPIFDAVVESIRREQVKLLDETPVKAGRKKKGKMQNAYFWPVMAGKKIAFLFFESREHRHVFESLGVKPEDGSVIVSDGYGAYEAYAKAARSAIKVIQGSGQK